MTFRCSAEDARALAADLIEAATTQDPVMMTFSFSDGDGLVEVGHSFAE